MDCMNFLKEFGITEPMFPHVLIRFPKYIFDFPKDCIDFLKEIEIPKTEVPHSQVFCLI